MHLCYCNAEAPANDYFMLSRFSMDCLYYRYGMFISNVLNYALIASKIRQNECSINISSSRFSMCQDCSLRGSGWPRGMYVHMAGRCMLCVRHMAGRGEAAGEASQWVRGVTYRGAANLNVVPGRGGGRGVICEHSGGGSSRSYCLVSYIHS